MAITLAALVMADEHPVRDQWVDDQARRAQSVVQVVPVDAAHYRGVWLTRGGAPVHVFAQATELIGLEQGAGLRPPRCQECQARVFPQDGPGVHSSGCRRGWAMYGPCGDCSARAGERCQRPGTHPHSGRRFAAWAVAAERRGDRHAPLW